MDTLIADKIDKFFMQFKHQIYRKGEILIRADDEPLGVFYLKDGIVIEYLISMKGSEVILEFFMPVSIFPLSWVINNTKNDYYFEAYCNTEVYRAPREKVIEFLKENPDVVNTLLGHAFEVIDVLKSRLAYGMSGDAYLKVIQELVILANAAGIKDNKSGSIQLKGFIERYAAARTGLAQETVSRAMRVLKEKKLLTFTRNTIVIKDLDLLKKELNVY